MNIVNVDGLGFIQTSEKFLVIIKNEIYGPYPNTVRTLRALLDVIEHPSEGAAIYASKIIREEKSKQGWFNRK